MRGRREAGDPGEGEVQASGSLGAAAEERGGGDWRRRPTGAGKRRRGGGRGYVERRGKGVRVNRPW
eukprot:399716-Hanusia_phi.AAC.1